MSTCIPKSSMEGIQYILLLWSCIIPPPPPWELPVRELVGMAVGLLLPAAAWVECTTASPYENILTNPDNMIPGSVVNPDPY